MSNFRPPTSRRRTSSTPHYQTFSTPPPRSAGRPLSGESSSSNGNQNHTSHHEANENNECASSTPIPYQQMIVLAFISFCEQTALNSISPYLPDMTSSFPGVSHHNVGMYVGTIASAFALAQFFSNYFWGWLSDHIGRKPVILLGTILTAACFLAFGYCRTLWQAIVVQFLMGMGNGNQGVVSTCLGEITDRSNQSRAFTYLPVIYGIGGIAGPMLGGLLVSKGPNDKQEYPYLAPNFVSAAILIFDFIVTSVFLEESVEQVGILPKIYREFRHLFTSIWQFTSSTRPTYLINHAGRERSRRPAQRRAQHSEDHRDDDGDSNSITAPLFRHFSHNETLNRDEVFNKDTILLLLTYLIFALSNVSFNALYPIFAQAPPPTGRKFSPKEIGLSLSFAGIVTIIFQICIFGKLRDKMGNRWSYRIGLFGFVLSFILMPLITHKDNAVSDGTWSKKNALLAIEVCAVLFIKSVAAVGGLTSSLLLITNSAPNTSVLGALNGLAQTLSAAGRAVGPFLSGSLFSLATKVKPKGEVLAFGVFGGVAFVGFALSFGIRSPSLEAAGWGDHDDDGDDDGRKPDNDDDRV